MPLGSIGGKSGGGGLLREQSSRRTDGSKGFWESNERGNMSRGQASSRSVMVVLAARKLHAGPARTS